MEIPKVENTFHISLSLSAFPSIAIFNGVTWKTSLDFTPVRNSSSWSRYARCYAIILCLPHRAGLLPMYDGPHALMANSLRPCPASTAPQAHSAVRETMGNPSFPRKKDQSIPGQTKNVVIMPWNLASNKQKAPSSGRGAGLGRQ